MSKNIYDLAEEYNDNHIYNEDDSLAQWTKDAYIAGFHAAIEMLNSREAHDYQRSFGSFINCARWVCWLRRKTYVK